MTADLFPTPKSVRSLADAIVGRLDLVQQDLRKIVTEAAGVRIDGFLASSISGADREYLQRVMAVAAFTADVVETQANIFRTALCRK